MNLRIAFRETIELIVFGIIVYYDNFIVCFWAKQTEGALKDGRQLPIKNNDNSYNIVASRSHINPETQQFIEQIQTTKPKKIISIGSSLKICLVAEGEADIYPRLGPTMEWDTAAAHAIVREAEASLVDFNSGDELKYNKENLLNPYFVVKRSVT